jgi:hypothetical protein
LVIASDGLRLTVRIPARLRRPAAIVDVAPAGPEPPIPYPTSNLDESGSRNLPLNQTQLPLWHSTSPNIFGLFRKYPRLSFSSPIPTVPDLNTPLNALLHSFLAVQKQKKRNPTAEEIIFPFPNISTFRFAHWFFTGGVKSRFRIAKDLLKG